jgi:hypothetical protein
MRSALGVIFSVFFLTGCSGAPPKPPQPEGDYRPVNAPRAHQAVFDFEYEGDILGALPALKAVAPQINVMPSLGLPSPLPVRLNLSGVRLEDALRAIGEQGGNVADVVWHSSQQPGSDQVFIRFRAPVASPELDTKQNRPRSKKKAKVDVSIHARDRATTHGRGYASPVLDYPPEGGGFQPELVFDEPDN